MYRVPVATCSVSLVDVNILACHIHVISNLCHLVLVLVAVFIVSCNIICEPSHAPECHIMRGRDG